MGCNCGGSTRRKAAGSEKTEIVRQTRAGGPGEKGYYWTGPPAKNKPKPA